MSLSLTEIQHVLEEVRPGVVGGRLDNAFLPDDAALVLTFYAQRAKRHLLVVAAPGLSRLHFISDRPAGQGSPPPFLREVRRVCKGRSLADVRLLGSDRIVQLVFGRPDDPAASLVAELTGRTSNVYLLSPDGRIITTLRSVRKSHRPLRPGALYEPPDGPPPSAGALVDRFADHAASYCEAIERHYAQADADQRLRSLRSRLASQLKARRKRLARLIDNLERDVAGADEAERLRLYGELLKCQLRAVPPRAASVALPNLFAPDEPDVVVPLLPNLSPRQNMERYFRRYKKLSASRTQGEARLADARRRLDAIDADATAVQEALTVAELEDLTTVVGLPAKGGKPRRRRAEPFHRFVSADGLAILVARNSRANDELTFRTARGNDQWLHVEGYTGSHVVVRVPKGKSMPKETLLDAATLAVHFSQLRRSGGGPVAYCACRNVAKPKGAGPGQVLYTQSKTLHLDVERPRIERLMRGDRATS